MCLEGQWREKTDDEVVAAARQLNDYTDQAKTIIRAELRRRNLVEPPLARPPEQEPASAIGWAWFWWLYLTIAGRAVRLAQNDGDRLAWGLLTPPLAALAVLLWRYRRTLSSIFKATTGMVGPSRSERGFRRIVTVLSLGLLVEAIATNSHDAVGIMASFGVASTPWVLLYTIRWIVRGFLREH